MDKLFSIIIPCHNSVKYLINCYNSIIRQTIDLSLIEIIFVDDASTDETYQLLCEMEQQFPDNIIVIHLDNNMRQGGARNIALNYATGQYISFIDSDDHVDLLMYKKLMNVIEQYHPDIIKFGHNVVTSSKVHIKTVGINANGFHSIHSEQERKKLLMSEVLDYGCWNKVYRRELIIRANAQFAEHVVYEEPKFVYPLLFFVDSYYFLDEPLYNYTYNQSGTMQNDMRIPGTLLQHPYVQLQTLNSVNELPPNIISSFTDEIEAYFIKSYFCETILFAIWGNLALDISDIQALADTVLRIYPNYKDNPYIKTIFPSQHLTTLKLLECPITAEFFKTISDDISRKESL